jgi:hypothetical protein
VAVAVAVTSVDPVYVMRWEKVSVGIADGENSTVTVSVTVTASEEDLVSDKVHAGTELDKLKLYDPVRRICDLLDDLVYKLLQLSDRVREKLMKEAEGVKPRALKESDNCADLDSVRLPRLRVELGVAALAVAVRIAVYDAFP